MGLYSSRSSPLTPKAAFSIPLFCGAILQLQAGMLFGPTPGSDRAMAMTALVAYALLAATIACLEKGTALGENRRER
ncbi:MAG TPA: hypothetical protein VLK65_26685 [Vicinamibacteria bacterium]|nr:hypothetical protein [Vicinamibacteria bacterium]